LCFHEITFGENGSKSKADIAGEENNHFLDQQPGKETISYNMK